MRIAVLDDYQGVAESLADWASLAPEGQVEFFHDHVADEVELARRLQPFAVVMVMRERTPFPRSLLEALPNLRLLVTSRAALRRPRRWASRCAAPKPWPTPPWS